MSHTGRVLSGSWGRERTVSAWFTAYESNPAGSRPVHIPAGSRIRIGDFQSATGVREIKLQDGSVLRVRWSELDGRSDAVEDVDGIAIGAGALSRTAQPGSFTSRDVDVLPFMTLLNARNSPAEVTVNQAFVAQNAVSSSPDVPLQRGSRLLLKGYRAVDGQMALASVAPGWTEHASFFATLITVSMSCLPTNEAMAEYRRPAPAPSDAAQSNSNVGNATSRANDTPAQVFEGGPAALDDAGLSELDVPSTPVSGMQDEGSEGAEEEGNSTQLGQLPVPPPTQARQHATNPMVAALAALQPNGTFGRALLTRDELRALSNVESKWTLQDLQFRLASMVNENFFTGFGAGRLSALLEPVDIPQLLPVHDPLINPHNESFTSKSGRSYVTTRVMSSAQGRVVHQGQSACTQCQKFAEKGWGKKRYCQCVTVADAAGNMVLGGACSNCAHGDHPEVCSFYAAD